MGAVRRRYEVSAATFWGRGRGEKGEGSGNQDDAEQRDVGCDLLHPCKGLIDENGTCPTGQGWREESDDRGIGEGKI